MPYTAGWNDPGYMPDHVDDFDTLQEAVAFLTNEIDFRWDGDYMQHPSFIDDDIDAKYLDIHAALHNLGNDDSGTFESWSEHCDGQMFFIQLTSH